MFPCLVHNRATAKVGFHSRSPTAALTERRRDRPLTKQANIGLLKVKLPKFPKGKKQTDKSLRKQTIEAIAYASVCREEAAPNPHTGG